MQMREGYGRSLFEPLLPLVLGRDVSGEVTAVGSNVRHFRVGDQVFGALHPTATRGTYSDYAILGEEQLAPKPESLSHAVRKGILRSRRDILLLIFLSVFGIQMSKT